MIASPRRQPLQLALVLVAAFMVVPDIIIDFACGEVD
jgi:hypothetical protein